MEGVTFVCAENGVYAVYRGSTLWHFTVFRPLSSPAISNGVLYIGANDDNVYALDAWTGAVLWSFPTGDIVASSPTVVGGVVYVGSFDGNVYALDASTGSLLWSYATLSSVQSSPAVVNGVVYVGSWMRRSMP